MSEKKITELLGLLDLDQKTFEITLEDHYVQLQCLESLAELAFRLRNEVKFSFSDGAEILHKHLFPGVSEEERQENALGWLCSFGEPTHFIVAALIAKESE